MEERAFDDLLELYRWRFGIDDPSILDWTGTMRVRPKITDPPVRDTRPTAPSRNTVVFGPSGSTLSHADSSVHIVVLGEEPLPAARAEAHRVARDAVVVWARDGTVSVEWLRERKADGPQVSVVVHGAGDDLDRCLSAIADTTPVTAEIEIVVGDDRNAAADEARGDVLVFVGGAAVVQPGWLRPLVRTLRNELDAGAAGGMLIEAGGALRAAGGVMFADGSLEGFARGLDPQTPPARDAAYLPSSLLAIRARLFRRIGGFDGLLGDGYEDADLCLRLRAAGRRVVYRPESVAVVDPPAGDADASDARSRFTKRWMFQLAAMPARPERLDAAAWDRLARAGAEPSARP